jgi:kinesin family protein 1
MDGNQTLITKPSTNEVKSFTFDKSYWSANKDDDHFANQELVYQDLGRELLDHAFDGYNCCIFACNNPKNQIFIAMYSFIY